jgi:hypothetical protein
MEVCEFLPDDPRIEQAFQQSVLPGDPSITLLDPLGDLVITLQGAQR